MKSFLKKTKLLTTICIISVLISILRVVTIDMPEWFNGADEWFQFIDNISMAYIASYLFYIVQVYIPQKKHEDSLIPLRAAIQREVQFFTIWIVTAWEEFYKHSIENGMKNDGVEDNFLSADIMLHVFDQIELSKECKCIADNIPEKTWKSYICTEYNKIIKFGEKIIAYRAAELPPDIYYAVFYLASESWTVFFPEKLLRNNYIGVFDTLGRTIPKNAQNGVRNIDMDIESIKKLITWVNQEYDFLHQQKKYSLTNIHRIDVCSFKKSTI